MCSKRTRIITTMLQRGAPLFVIYCTNVTPIHIRLVRAFGESSQKYECPKIDGSVGNKLPESNSKWTRARELNTRLVLSPPPRN